MKCKIFGAWRLDLDELTRELTGRFLDLDKLINIPRLSLKQIIGVGA